MNQTTPQQQAEQILDACGLTATAICTDQNTGHLATNLLTLLKDSHSNWNIINTATIAAALVQSLATITGGATGTVPSNQLIDALRHELSFRLVHALVVGSATLVYVVKQQQQK